MTDNRGRAPMPASSIIYGVMNPGTSFIMREGDEYTDTSTPGKWTRAVPMNDEISTVAPNCQWRRPFRKLVIGDTFRRGDVWVFDDGHWDTVEDTDASVLGRGVRRSDTRPDPCAARPLFLEKLRDNHPAACGPYLPCRPDPALALAANKVASPAYVFQAHGVKLFEMGPDGLTMRAPNGKALIEVTADGVVTVRGSKVADDVELYRDFKFWLDTVLANAQGRPLPPPAAPGLTVLADIQDLDAV